MTTYLSDPIEVDRSAIKQTIVDDLESGIPGLEVAPGTLLDYLCDGVAGLSAEDRQLLTDQLAIAFRYYGQKILRIAQRDAIPAGTLATFVASDTAGHTIDAGLQITLAGLDSARQAFQVVNPVTIPAAVGKAVTGVASTDLFTSAAHGYTLNQPVSFSGLTGGAGITPGIPYYVIGPTTNTFQVSATIGGAAINFTTDLSAGTVTAWPSTGIGEVELVAVVPGEAGNGLSADPQPEQTVAWLQSITIIAPTAGGADAEDDDAYLDRLADTTPLSGFTLVLPADFERAARTLLTDNGRALALDRYKPGPPYDADPADPDVDKTVTVALVNADGGDYGAPFRSTVEDTLEATREIGFQVFVIPPTYTALTIAFTGVALAGFDAADVEARAEAAVLDFINPANWGLPASGDQRLWIDTPVVRFQDISTVLNNVEGFDHWTALTVNGGTADVTLTGPAALPDPASTASGTVTA